MSITNESKPTPGGITNEVKASIGETWNTWTTAWDDETRTWDELSQLIENNTKPFILSSVIETEYKYPTQVVEQSGANTWSNPSRIMVDDGSYASFSNSSYVGTLTSTRLVATDFGFSVPLNATLTAITVAYDSYSLNGDARIRNETLFLGAQTGFRGHDPMWFTSLRPLDVNSSEFGCTLQGSSPFNDAIYIDAVKIKISYVIPLNAPFTNESKP